MSNDNSGDSCAKSCGIKGAIAGLVFALIFYILADFSFMKALFWGIVIAVIVALALWYFICGKTQSQQGTMADAGLADRRSAAVETGASTSVTPATEDTSAPAPDVAEPAAPSSSDDASGGVDAAPSVASDTPTKAFQMQPSAKLAGQEELAGRKGTWKYEGTAAASSASAPVAKAPVEAPVAAEAPAPAAPAKTAPAKKEPAKKAPAKKAPAKKAAKTVEKADETPKTKPKRAPVAADGQPEVLSGPRAGSTADDLKLISGVGPKLEQTLNELGFYHFDQIAGWRKKEIEWVDSRLRFKGRIERDNWMSQAKILAKGGETEFSARKKK